MSATSALNEQLATLARQLRLGYSTEACVDLPEVMDRVAAGLTTQPAAQQQAFAICLNGALQSWERRDWLGLADALEYELATLLA
jgi:hypothetical protein